MSHKPKRIYGTNSPGLSGGQVHPGRSHSGTIGIPAMVGMPGLSGGQVHPGISHSGTIGIPAMVGMRVQINGKQWPNGAGTLPPRAVGIREALVGIGTISTSMWPTMSPTPYAQNAR